MAKGNKQKRIEKLEALLNEATPVEWAIDRDANSALVWMDKRDKMLKEGMDTNEKEDRRGT